MDSDRDVVKGRNVWGAIGGKLPCEELDNGFGVFKFTPIGVKKIRPSLEMRLGVGG